MTAHLERIDPYENQEFQITWDDEVVAGLGAVGVSRRTDSSVRSPGEPSFDDPASSST